jgi:hypothetical protein
LNESWAGDIAATQKEEHQELKIVHELVKQQTDVLEKMAQSIESKDSQIKNIEKKLKQILEHQMVSNLPTHSGAG